MKQIISKIILILIVQFLSFHSFSQIKTIMGKVTTLGDVPLIGAEVTVKSTNNTYYTDSTGVFKAQCDWNDKLKIKAEGFLTENVKITDKIRVVAVNLKPKANNMNKEYDIGYGKVSEANRSSAVSGLDDNDTEFTRYKDMYELIQANFAGVQIRNGEILVRGASSFNSSSAALIVVDGVISDSDILRQLRPINVKSINIIKDGSTAVYGARGANGVVLIETKKGS